ncbi:MAG: ATP-binding protein, partial [Myxococcota bacterium]
DGEPIEAQAIAHVKSRVTSGAMDAHFSRDGKLYSIAPIRYNESIIGYLVGDIALRRIAQDVAVPPDDGAFVAYVTRQGETITGSLSPNFNLTPPTVTTSDVMHRTHGDAYLATWGRAPAGGWIVLLTSQKVAAGLEGILRKVGILLLFLWIVFVAAAAIALKIWVISPVARIAHAARCVTEGDLVARAPPSSIRELDSLSVRFNAMTSRLVELLEQVQQDNVSLEERIRQRTSELAVALEKAEVASRAKDQFVATVSHELRTPLQGIVAASELLETKHPDETVRRNVNVIRASSRALRRVVGQVLDFSKVEAVPLERIVERFTVSELIDTIEARFRTQAENKGVSLNITPPEASITCSSDQPRILQVLANLVDNAIKFTGEGQVDVIFAVDSVGDGEAMLRMEVTDTGPGVPEVERDTIFETFQRGSSAPAVEGVGLGLAISLKLAEYLGGKLECKPRDVGAHFVFSVPVQIEHIETKSLSFDVATDAVWSLEPRRAPVLIADDHPVNRMLLGRIFEDMGFEPLVASTAEEAIDIASARFLAAAFVDWQMPPTTGDAVARAVRAMPSPLLNRCPLVTVTGVATAEVRHAATEAGFDAFMVKPVGRKDLRSMLVSPRIGAQVDWRCFFDTEQLDDLRTMTSRGDEVVFEAASGLFTDLEAIEAADGWLTTSSSKVREQAHKLVGVAAGLGAHSSAEVFRCLEQAAEIADNDLTEAREGARRAARTLLNQLEAMLSLAGEGACVSRQK